MFSVGRHLTRIWNGKPRIIQPGILALLQRSVTDDASSDSKSPVAPKHTGQNIKRKVKHSVKSKKDDAGTLIKKVTESLHHPTLGDKKERSNTRNRIENRLRLITTETNLRKVDGCSIASDHKNQFDSIDSEHGGRKSPDGHAGKFQDGGFTYENSKYVLKEKRLQRTPDEGDNSERGAKNSFFKSFEKRKGGLESGKRRADIKQPIPPSATHLSDDSVLDDYVKTLLNSKERLGLFDSLGEPGKDIKEMKEVTGTEGKTAIEWWDEYEAEAIKKASYKQVKSSYEELLNWMNENRLPEFPINNEIGMEHEADVPFHRHVFLHEQIEEGFPKQGPVRQFMEAVILGLSKNPYLTIEEKTDHINWFREYFNEKYELLKTLGAVKEDIKLQAGEH